jgi:hypothetical protein
VARVEIVQLELGRQHPPLNLANLLARARRESIADMTKTMMFVAILLATGGVAQAGGQSGSFGAGAEVDLNGVGGLSGSYDGGKFDADAFLGYRRYDIGGGMSDSLTEVGARVFFHVHSTALSDFGIGGGFALASVPGGGMGAPRTTPVFLEPGFQIRLFLSSNVALSFMGGMSIGLNSDATTSLLVGGQSIGGSATDFGGGTLVFHGGAGVHYYFF